MRSRSETRNGKTIISRGRRFVALFVIVAMMMATIAYGFDGAYASEDYVFESESIVENVVEQDTLEVLFAEDGEVNDLADEDREYDYIADDEDRLEMDIENEVEAEFGADIEQLAAYADIMDAMARGLEVPVFTFLEIELAVLMASSLSAPEITIRIGDDIDFLRAIVIPSSLTVNLLSDGNPHTLRGAAGAGGNFSAFNINGVLRLNDDYLTLSEFRSAIFVNESGVFEMHAGTISNNTGQMLSTPEVFDVTYGGGVIVKGTFDMYGGIISHNNAERGGGVNVKHLGVFNLYDGAISSNEADNGGGVSIHMTGTFNMYGGIIEYNRAIETAFWNPGARIGGNGGGIGVDIIPIHRCCCLGLSYIVNMSGGIISNNDAFRGGAIGFHSFWDLEEEPWQFRHALQNFRITNDVTFIDNTAERIMGIWIGEMLYNNVVYPMIQINPVVIGNGNSGHPFDNRNIHIPIWGFRVDVDDHAFTWGGGFVEAFHPFVIDRVEYRPGYDFAGWEFRLALPSSFEAYVDFTDSVELIEEYVWDRAMRSMFSIDFLKLIDSIINHQQQDSWLHIPRLHATAIWEPIQSGNTPDATRNLAYRDEGTVMTASSSRGVRVAANTNNGIRSGAVTQSWSADTSGQEWLQASFSEAKNFNHIRVYLGHVRTRDFRFEYFNDDEATWETFYSGTQLPATYYHDIPTTIQAQHVRLVSGHSNNPDLPIVVFEFEVYYMP